LQEQADGPVNNPIEMATNWEEVIPKLEQDEALTQEFLAVYPEGYSKDTITEAIAEFEETLITPNAPFDKYLMGDENAIGEDAKQGYAHFKEFNCATCHVGKILGGQSFEKIGLKADYYADRGIEVIPEDLGRFNVTKDENDRYRLKTPTLRNITVTYPYFHDGSTSDLGEAVEVMAKYQVGKTLSPQQNEQIVAFLETLTGEYNGEPLQ
jgi:cytochrome c peroxidase